MIGRVSSEDVLKMVQKDWIGENSAWSLDESVYVLKMHRYMTLFATAL